ncbi:hypothetical protein [Nonomuraea recticatena]|uniref:hypothetical protein n=1 Tax=Nonomuraea recticatena TaxID=46178 RepID=UPI003618B13B
MSGLMLVPCAVAFALVGLAWPKLPQRFQRSLVPVGYVVAAPAYLGLAAASGAACRTRS